MSNNNVKPYLARIKNWKIRNMFMMYLEAREKFKNYRKMIKKSVSISFEGMKEICDILFEIKEDYHLLFKRLLDPKKMKFEKTHKYLPDSTETEFMNNVGLLFHKVMVARELKYSIEHYVEESEAFRRTGDDLQYHLMQIEELFDDGIEILKSMILSYTDNILLLTLLLESPLRTKKHFGHDAVQLIEQFVDGKGLDEVYYSVGRFYVANGWKDKAKGMLKEAVKRNPAHEKALQQLNNLP